MFSVTTNARAHACVECCLWLRKKLLVISVARNAVRSCDADVGRVARSAVVTKKRMCLGERAGADELLPPGKRVRPSSMDEQRKEKREAESPEYDYAVIDF